MTQPDFRAELQRLVDLYEALGGNWCPHGYTDTWNDALASALTALAAPEPEPLSPAAEAVYDARCGIAAALRAAANQVVPHEKAPVLMSGPDLERLAQRQHTRAQILAIATELEAQ